MRSATKSCLVHTGVPLAAALVLTCVGCGPADNEDVGATLEAETADAGAEEPDAAPPGVDGSAETAVSHATQECTDLAAQTCRMSMSCCGEDAEFDTILEVRRGDDGSVVVTDGPDTESPWVVHVEVAPDGTLETQAGVPSLTCREIVEDYGEAGPWESYEVVDGYPCSEIDSALIRFFVMEWFYFG